MPRPVATRPMRLPATHPILRAPRRRSVGGGASDGSYRGSGRICVPSSPATTPPRCARVPIAARRPGTPAAHVDLAGTVGPVSVVSLSVTILRPVGDVFEVLTDVGNAATWSSALEEQLITPGPLRVGSRRRAVVPTIAGRTMENEMELTEFVPDRRLAMRGVAASHFRCGSSPSSSPPTAEPYSGGRRTWSRAASRSCSARCSPRATSGHSPRIWPD